MKQSKHWAQSKTVWGALLALAAAFAQMAGVDLGDLSGLAEPIAVVVGGGLAIYGRVTASTEIKGKRT